MPVRPTTVLTIACIFWSLATQGQTCQNPGARLARLTALQVNRDSIYKRIKNDLAFIQPSPHDTIADIGCFDGYYPCVYSIFSDSVVFYLNDITEAGLAYFDNIRAAAEKIRGSHFTNTFTYIIGNDSLTGLQDHRFNKVVLRDALHHFKLQEAMLTDIKRIMKPGASLILFEPVRKPDVPNETLCKGAMTHEALLNRLQTSGFTLTKELQHNASVSWFEFRLAGD